MCHRLPNSKGKVAIFNFDVILSNRIYTECIYTENAAFGNNVEIFRHYSQTPHFKILKLFCTLGKTRSLEIVSKLFDTIPEHRILILLKLFCTLR